MTEHAPDLDVMHARQARRGRHALIILVASLALVIMALFGAWAYYAGDLARGRGDTEVPHEAARTVSETPSAVKQTAETAPAGAAGG